MFSILLGNMFAPIIDYAVKGVKQKRKVLLEGIK
jgi:Na+-translocating ferredoxin:NAD+ oxidoreductase RnfD subunit